MSGKDNIALLLLNLPDLTYGGGAERALSDIFEYYNAWHRRKYELYLIIDRDSLNCLLKINRIGNNPNILILETVNGITSLYRYGKYIDRYCYKHSIKLLHFPIISKIYLPYFFYRSILKVRNTIKICGNVVDSNISHIYFDKNACIGTEQKKSYYLHWLYFHLVKLNGILTWYKLFYEKFKNVHIFGNPKILPVSCYFLDTEKYRPSDNKENVIVFAARFVEAKNPILFLSGIREVLKREPELLDDWRVEIYGNGPLRDEMKSFVLNQGLVDKVQFKINPDLATVFTYTRLFVSTQERENFTSLSMIEAMSCGNAIIAKNAGQTVDFVRNNINGILYEESTPASLANAIIYYLSNHDLHETYSANSRELVKNEHNKELFFHSCLGIH